MTQLTWWQEQFEERAAIVEYAGHVARREAERLALACVRPNRATTSFTLAGHSADFTPSVPTRRA